MKYEFDFDPDKNELLKKDRCISFEEVISLIDEGFLVDIVDHPNQLRHPKQKIYIIDVEGYAYLVPFIENPENKIFLKTIFPSRKATKDYLNKKERKEKNENN